MTTNDINKLFFSHFDCHKRTDEWRNCLGYYSFHALEVDQRGEMAQAMICGLWVYVCYGRVTFTADVGDPPSVRAGLALDLHRAAVARIREQARLIRKPVAYFIDDAGKVAASSYQQFWDERAPLVLAAAPVASQSGEAYRLGTSYIADRASAPALAAPAP